MEVTVQRVRTMWSKRSRGFPRAALRNATPVAFELPPGLPPLVHDVVMDERDDFLPVHRLILEVPSLREFGLRPIGEVLRVQLPNGFGAPVRGHRPVVILQRGEWVQWQLNNRRSSLAGRADWHYQLTTVSIAFGPVARDAFLGEAPHLVDERAPLR